MIKTFDRHYLIRCSEVANQSTGGGKKVGVLIVKNHRILSVGYQDSHHAEVNALQQAKEEVTGATLYSSEKPCLHCIQQINQAGIKKIIYPKLFPDGYRPFINQELNWVEIEEMKGSV